MTIAAIGIACSLIGAILIAVYRDSKAVKAASPLFLIFILLGVTLSCISVFFWSGKPTTSNCMTRTWLGGIGFIFIFGSLIVKTWRISRIFSSQKVKSLRVPDSLLVSMIAIMLVFELVSQKSKHTNKQKTTFVYFLFFLTNIFFYLYFFFFESKNQGHFDRLANRFSFGTKADFFGFL